MTTTITTLIEKIQDECTPVDREAAFDAMLDDCYSFEKVGGPFAYMSPSRVLKEVDPVAYRCGVNDYADSEEWLEIAGDYYRSDEVENVRDAFISDLESEVSDLEGEIEDLEVEDESDLQEASSLQRRIHDLNAQIAQAKA